MMKILSLKSGSVILKHLPQWVGILVSGPLAIKTADGGSIGQIP
jgi:hypothetical protein